MFSLSRHLFDDLWSFHRQLDNLFERAWEPSLRLLPSSLAESAGFYPEVESYVRDSNVVYRFAIPGVDPKNVDISLQANLVTVKGERTAPSGVQEENWHVRGIRYGQFERSFTLPQGAEADKLQATFNNGVLELSVPISKAHLPRKIEIQQLSPGSEKPKLKASA
ncbi:MAG: Hsp20/alpha crystallin family protein [Acidobacteriota bacterium]